MSVPHFFLVSLPSSAKRRERMVRRFGEQFLPFTIVNACDGNSAAARRHRPEPPNQPEANAAACYASHLLALRMFVETGEHEAIVIEDDVRLIKGFREKWEEQRPRIAEGCPLVSLSYLVWNWEGFRYIATGLSTMGADLWGTQMYWLRRSYALSALERLDKPFSEVSTRDVHTAELIVRSSGGLVAYPPFGLEELSGSVIAPEAGNSNHGEALRIFDSGNYVE